MLREPVPRPSAEKFFELAKSPDVTILVGPDEVAFKLPRDLLGYYSPYFKACFNGNFKEGQEGVLRLPEDNPEYIKLLGYYMMDSNVRLAPSETLSPERLKFCLELVPFADKYDFPNLLAFTERYLEPMISLGAPDPKSKFYNVLLNAPSPEHLDHCLQLLPQQNSLLRLFANACLYILDKNHSGAGRMLTKDLVTRNDNLALKMMHLMMAEITSDYYYPTKANETKTASTFILPEHIIQVKEGELVLNCKDGKVELHHPVPKVKFVCDPSKKEVYPF